MMRRKTNRGHIPKKAHNQMTEKELNNLLSIAKDYTPLSKKVKKSCKKEVMLAIKEIQTRDSLTQIQSLLKTSAKTVKPSKKEHDRIRQHVWQAIHTPKPSLWKRTIFSLTLWRRMTAIGLSAAMVLLAIQWNLTSVPQISASGMYVHVIYGGAAIKFGNTLNKAVDNQLVTAKDTLITGKDSLIELKLFDHSVVRLGENTTVNIVNVTPSEEIVTLDLEGTAWVKTLEDTSHINIRTSSSTSISVPKGVVSIESNERVTKVLTRENVAIVEVAHPDESGIKTQKVQVAKDHIAYIPTALKNEPVQDIKARPANVEKILDPKWVEENVEQDKQYIATIQANQQEEIKKSAGTLPTSPLYAAKKASEKAKLSILATEDKPGALLATAEQRLHEALTLFAAGENEEAVKIFEEYKTLLEEVLRLANEELYGTHGEELLKQIKEQLTKAQAETKQILDPETPAYTVRTTIEEHLLDLAGEKERIEEIDSIAQGQLYEILDLIEEGKEDVARIHFSGYADITQESFDQAMKLLREGDSKLAETLMQQKQDIELPLLTILEENKTFGSDVTALKKSITASIDQVSQTLEEKTKPKATLSGVVKIKETPKPAPVVKESISVEESAPQPSFRVSGVAKK